MDRPGAEPAMTSSDTRTRRVPTFVQRSYAPSSRDRAVVEFVGKWNQVQSAHVKQVLFEDVTQTPCDRALQRLTDHGYLSRLRMRLVGGSGGGSSQYVYQLGREGWRLLDMKGTYYRQRAINLHTLDVTSLYVSLVRAERAGRYVVRHAVREPRTGDLTPDMYIQLDYPEEAASLPCYVELDRGTERASKIMDKCVRYWRAYQAQDGGTFPTVLFVVPDAERKREIEQVISGGPEEAHELFKVLEFSTAAQKLSDF